MQDFKKNTVFTVAVAVLVPKYICGQYLCEQAHASTAIWKLWRVDLKNKYYIYYSCASLFSQESVSNGFLFFVR